MEYRRLGRSDLQVSLLCLGSMTWGMQNSEDEAFAQMDYAFEQGVNFIDTAEMYPIATSAETYGRTEENVGNWLQARSNRDNTVVPTPIVGPNPAGFPDTPASPTRLTQHHHGTTPVRERDGQ